MRTWLFQVSRLSLALCPRRLTEEKPEGSLSFGLVHGQRWTDAGKEESSKTVLERRVSLPLALRCVAVEGRQPMQSLSGGHLLLSR